MVQENRTASWSAVFLASLILLGGLIFLWRDYDCCSHKGIDPLQFDHNIVDRLNAAQSNDLFKLTTGIYVQSLSFASANDVEVTGRIWQRVPPGMELPDGAEMGVLFPDAITKHEDNLTPIYQNFSLPSGARLFVWNFQVTMRQGFDYSAYPLDGKLVWIRFWTNDVENNVQLVPDLGSYTSTAPGSGMGISETLVSGEWQVKDSFFGYEQVSYGTDFGRDTRGLSGKPLRPELRFYIVLKRNFTDAFLVNLVPLFVTLGLLFGLMMTVSRDPDEAGRLGFNTMAVFGSTAGLFFISLLGHIQIRQQFAGSQIVYIEYFYIVSYVVLLFVSVFSFWITYSENPKESWLLRRDGHNVKLFYWPAILICVLAISIWQLHFAH